MDKQLCLNLAVEVLLPVKASMQSFVRLIHPAECFLCLTENTEVLRRVGGGGIKREYCSFLSLLLCHLEMTVNFCWSTAMAGHSTVVVMTNPHIQGF